MTSKQGGRDCASSEGFSGLKREEQAENRSFGGFGLDFHAPTMLVHDLLHDRESEAGAVLLADG